MKTSVSSYFFHPWVWNTKDLSGELDFTNKAGKLKRPCVSSMWTRLPAVALCMLCRGVTGMNPAEGMAWSPCMESVADVQILGALEKYQSSAQLLYVDMNMGDEGM